MHDPILSQPPGKHKARLPAFEGFQDPRRQYTQVPDYLLDFLLPELLGSELKILLYLIRHAFGYGRESVAVSWSRFLDGTVTREGKRLDWGAGVRRDALKEGLPSLADKGLITKERQSSERRGNEASLYTLHIRTSRGEEEPSSELAAHPGFFRIPNSTNMPNQLFDALLPHLTEGELKVLCYIIRRTIGMKVESAAISYSQFAQGITTGDGRVLDRGTGLSEATIKRALKGLEDKRCVMRERPAQSGTDEPNRYRLYFVEDVEQGSHTTQGEGSETAQGGDQKPHKPGVSCRISTGDQKPHKGGLRNHTHKTQYLNTEKHSQQIQQQPTTDTDAPIADVVVALIDRGVTRKTAEDLVRARPAEHILAQIDMLSYRPADDPAAVLVKAIREEWAPPAVYQTPEQREAEVREAERIEAELEAWRQAQTLSRETGNPAGIQSRCETVEFRPFQAIALDSRRVWATAVLDLKSHDGVDAYLRGTRLLAREGDELVVGTGTAYAAEWLQRRIAHRAAQLLSAIGGEDVAVRFVAETNWRAQE